MKKLAVLLFISVFILSGCGASANLISKAGEKLKKKQAEEAAAAPAAPTSEELLTEIRDLLKNK